MTVTCKKGRMNFHKFRNKAPQEYFYNLKLTRLKPSQAKSSKLYMEIPCKKVIMNFTSSAIKLRNKAPQISPAIRVSYKIYNLCGACNYYNLELYRVGVELT